MEILQQVLYSIFGTITIYGLFVYLSTSIKAITEYMKVGKSGRNNANIALVGLIGLLLTYIWL